MNFFNPAGSRYLQIMPASYSMAQRVEGSIRAAELGMGLVMEVGSSRTTFYASPGVPVGEVRVYASRSYGEAPLYDRTLSSPTEYWEPWRVWGVRIECDGVLTQYITYPTAAMAERIAEAWGVATVVYRDTDGAWHYEDGTPCPA